MGSQVRVLYRAPHVKVPESLRFRGFRYFDELGVWKNLPNHLKSYKNCRSLTAKKQAALIYWAACFCISGCLKIRPAHEIIQRHTVYSPTNGVQFRSPGALFIPEGLEKPIVRKFSHPACRSTSAPWGFCITPEKLPNCTICPHDLKDTPLLCAVSTKKSTESFCNTGLQAA